MPLSLRGLSGLHLSSRSCKWMILEIRKARTRNRKENCLIWCGSIGHTINGLCKELLNLKPLDSPVAAVLEIQVLAWPTSAFWFHRLKQSTQHNPHKISFHSRAQTSNGKTNQASSLIANRIPKWKRKRSDAPITLGTDLVKHLLLRRFSHILRIKERRMRILIRAGEQRGPSKSSAPFTCRTHLFT